MDLPIFEPATMAYLPPHMSGHHGLGPHGDPFQDMVFPMEMRDYSTYPDSDDLSMHGLHSAPMLKRYPSGYDDPFSDVVSAFEHPVNHELQDPETPSIDRDNKLLSFTPPTFDYTLLDYTYRRTNLSLSAQLHGMFFLAESPWASATDVQAPPSELTCYRRNLFQITGDIMLPRGLRYIMTEQGEQIPIIGQELAISATESTEGNPVKIISVPWKTPANPNAPVVEDKVEREPPSIPLDVVNMQDVSTEFTTFPFQWKRLQFRIATANNGRRKELQQHFVVKLKLLATLSNGGKIPICEVQSGPIIVRGRSPRNFQSRKDLPLNGSGHARKSTSGAGGAGLARTLSGDSAKSRPDVPAPTSMPKLDTSATAMSMSTFFDPDEPASTTQTDQPEWRPLDLQRTAITSNPLRSSPPAEMSVNAYPLSSPDLTAALRRPSAPPVAPIQLSLVEDDSPKSGSLPSSSARTPPDGNPRQLKRMHIPQRTHSFGVNTINSPDESADLLYEYFPLGLDDWMPPVDAVYRPHVVHHIKVPTNPMDPVIGGKNARGKRYFSEEVC